MLGWEYPPHISGGLGTACEGLTVALARHNIELLFVVPHLFGGEDAPHMKLVDSRGETEVLGEDARSEILPQKDKRKDRVNTLRVPSFLQPYMSPENYSQWVTTLQQQRAKSAVVGSEHAPRALTEMFEANDVRGSFDRYSGDIFAEVSKFASNVVALLADKEFDVIHAHDWLTYPAGVALSALTGKPLVAHVHSLEFDRSGQAVNSRINEIEKWGLQSATSVIAVSYYTRSMINKLHGIPLQNISVVHNGVYAQHVVQSYRQSREFDSRIVLFLGRITFQKGPDYLVEAASRVIPHVPDALFVMAGAGDMLPQVTRRIKELGIEKHFYFPGFLKGQEVEQMFSLADVYVMPSVSEPFGISALEAISFNTPVIISRQSGVSEVLGHALKVDFWDIDRLADLIINALLHEELRADMISMAREEVKRLHWDAAALKTLDVYRSVLI